MPYKLSTDAPGCDGIAVVKTLSGEVMGCHRNVSDAEDQLTALRISEDEYRAESFRPTSDMAAEAQQGLDWRAEFGRGGTMVGVARARDISNRTELSADTVRRMVSFFARHEVDKDAEGFRAGEDGYPSAGRIAWALWGGDPGRAWATEIYDATEPEGRAVGDASTPAPLSDQITGSKKNPSGSASTTTGGIELSESAEKGLVNKTAEHNDKMKTDGRPDWTLVTVGALRAVYRRGAGAFSTSHRPGVTRGQWAMARVNAFLYLSAKGKPENNAYVSDYDLLNRGHPKYSEKKGMTMNDENFEVSAEMDGLDLSPVQTTQYHDDMDLVHIFGKYSQDIGAGGAFYLRQSPFAELGLMCGSCAHYEGGGCHIVAGEIYEDGLCKRWIIPENMIVDAEPVDEIVESDETEENGMGYMKKDDEEEMSVRYSDLEMPRRRVQNRDVEFRTVSVGSIEVRSAGEGLPMNFRGYAAVFNAPSEPLPFTETIRPGAFKRSLQAGREVRMFVNHNTDMVLGSTRSGTIRVTEDKRGLLVEGELPDTTYARDLSVLMQRGDVHGMSFGFSVPRGGDSWSQDGAQRELGEVILHEVSVVTGFPAYPDTSGATVRATETEPEIVETPAGNVPVSVARRLNDLYARKA
tara:strand:+ start:567 stop:2474 length:1908 start_codon:yes stop_codon:yes gene_type:complete